MSSLDPPVMVDNDCTDLFERLRKASADVFNKLWDLPFFSKSDERICDFLKTERAVDGRTIADCLRSGDNEAALAAIAESEPFRSVV